MGVKCSERTTSYQPEQDKKMKKLNRQIEKKFNITSVTAVKKKSLSLPRKVVNWNTGSVSSTRVSTKHMTLTGYLSACNKTFSK